MEIRKKPEYADTYGWDDFNEWADRTGISTKQEDWEKMWDCWVASVCYKSSRS